MSSEVNQLCGLVPENHYKRNIFNLEIKKRHKKSQRNYKKCVCMYVCVYVCVCVRRRPGK
jgi:hypothetical protein